MDTTYIQVFFLSLWSHLKENKSISNNGYYLTEHWLLPSGLHQRNRAGKMVLRNLLMGSKISWKYASKSGDLKNKPLTWQYPQGHWRKYTERSISNSQTYSKNVLSASSNHKDISKGWWWWKSYTEGLSWILGSQVGCEAVSSLIFLTCKRKQIGSGCVWESINP